MESRKRTTHDVYDDDSSSSDSDTSSDRNENQNSSNSSKGNKLKYSGSFKYRVSFKEQWTTEYPVKAVLNDKFKFHCLPCRKNISCSHQGVGDVKSHCKRPSHKENEKSMKRQKTLFSFAAKDDESFDSKVSKAEIQVTNFLIQHNLPIATADHLGPLFKEIFPDSKIASKYSSGRTKTTAILNESLAPHCHNFIVKHCKDHPYSVSTDGSNDTGIQKMNPVSIRLFDINTSKTVSNHFYNMCLTEGESGAKAFKIFEAVETTFDQDKLPWMNCVSLSVDNTNTMIGANNSLASRFLEKNCEIFVGGCVCHLAHIAASHGNDAFSDVLGINVEDICIDCFYWFDKSAKRKGKLTEYFEFCDQQYQCVLKHLSVRWLSLERCMERILKKLPSLKSYFLSEKWADERFKRLHGWFSNPLLEPALLFQTSAITMFTHFNLLLQRDEPSIHLLKPTMESLGKKLASRIIKPAVLQNTSTLLELDLDNNDIYKDPKSLYIGFTTKCVLNKLLNDGTITEKDSMTFNNAAHNYFKSAVEYIQAKFPLDNDVIKNAVWIDVCNRLNSSWENVHFFLEKYKSLSTLDGIDDSEIYDEFVDYQTLADESFNKNAWEEAKVIEGYDGNGHEMYHYRIDILWWHLNQMEIPGSKSKRFKLLPKIAEIVLVLPHSNAEAERLFSIVRKNKTDSRSCLKLDGSLSGILAMKSHYPESRIPCHKWVPKEDIMKAAKTATVRHLKK